MKSASYYLFLNGNCRSAMEFYQTALGGELKVFTVGQADQKMFKDHPSHLVLNSRLKAPGCTFMGSDNMKGDTQFGDNVWLYID